MDGDGSIDLIVMDGSMLVVEVSVTYYDCERREGEDLI